MGNYASWMTTTALSATVADFGTEVMDNFFDKNAVMKAIKKYGGLEEKNTGDEFTVPVIKEAGNVQWFTRTTKISDNMPDPVATTEWQMRFCQVPVKVYWTDEVKNRQSKGKLFDYVQTLKDVQKKTYESEMETAFWRATPSANSINSFQTLIDATETVGGLNPTTYTWWVSQTKTTTSFASTGITDMQSFLITLDAEGAKTDVIFMGTTEYGYFLKAVDDRSILQNGANDVGFGIGKVPFNGIPVEISNKLTSGEAYYIDFSTIKLRVNKGATTMTAWVDMENEVARKAHYLYCQELYSNNRRRNGVHTISGA